QCIICADRVLVRTGLAAEELAARLRALLHAVWRLAVRARPRDRRVPRGPVAFRVARAAPPRPAPARPLLAHIADAALRALQPGHRARLRVPALRIVAARDERTETTLALDHLAAALLALLARRHRLLLLLVVERPCVAALG